MVTTKTPEEQKIENQLNALRLEIRRRDLELEKFRAAMNILMAIPGVYKAGAESSFDPVEIARWINTNFKKEKL